jgi:hypothetical protein
VDFQGLELFSDDTHPLQPPSYRSLCIQDPRVVAKYIETLSSKLDYHKVADKCTRLHQEALLGNWSEALTKEYASLNDTISKAMIFAESMAGHRITKTFEWSPSLKATVQKIRYWKLHLRLLRGASITDNSLQKLHQEAFQSPYEPDDLSQSQIILQIKDSYNTLNSYKKLHRQLRESHLDSLADAIVLHHSPNLIHDSVSHIKEERKLKTIKHLRFRECMHRIYKKIGFTIKPTNTLGLNKIDTPDSSIQDPTLGNPTDPKNWKGPWLSITDPTDIAQEVIKMNIA